MKREYGWILIVYIAMQLSSLAGVPLLTFIFVKTGSSLQEAQMNALNSWLLVSFFSAFLIILFLLRKEMSLSFKERNKADLPETIGWAIGGIFLALFAQASAASIERMLGIEMGSENTQNILRMIESFPAVIFISSVIGPILEEIVFRKIIFGSLYKRFNFFISGLISSIIFAAAHMEFEHILLYSAIGFTFAFLYIQTKRIIVPIFAHVAMNTLVVLMQSIYREDIEKILRQAEQLQNFIGGFL
ncbi:CPBP family intramembrane metalloprotease [Neobacillus notoginsengisoli]|uniref:CPBP family intramembrane metalloprotease n=1 Tax=Neobacillus notoginsengisoli TaxID=1578198 RepID=A0A417YFP3_9BACI|nr:type II CAAX endopeptidase family protein [Neobacillus notoginsengisoli]RHW31513.1 CPBP family intramembrane metalloprotease [Neobacillus notoginsengisoli]